MFMRFSRKHLQVGELSLVRNHAMFQWLCDCVQHHLIVIYCVLNAVILEFVSVEKSGLCFHVPRVESTRLVVSTVSTIVSLFLKNQQVVYLRDMPRKLLMIKLSRYWRTRKKP